MVALQSRFDSVDVSGWQAAEAGTLLAWALPLECADENPLGTLNVSTTGRSDFMVVKVCTTLISDSIAILS